MSLPAAPQPRRRADKALLSLDAVISAGLVVLADDGLDAVTMRRVAEAVDTGPASIYRYVPHRDALLEAMFDRVLGEVQLEPPDPARWREQIHALMDQTVAALRRHPRIARVGLANVPTGGSSLQIREAMLACLLAGDIDAQGASWAIDTLALLALATALELTAYAERGADLTNEDERITRAYSQLSPDTYPVTVAHLTTVLNGTLTERFAFAIDTHLDGLLSNTRPA